MADAYLYAELLVNVFSQVLRTIDGTVLTARTAKAEHQTGEAALDITAHVGISQFIDAVEECQYLTIVFQESDDRFVKSRQLLIRFVTAWVMRGTTVEDIAATIARLILWNTLGLGEAEDAHHQRPLRIVLGERCRTILWMGLIGIHAGCLITVGTTGGSLHILELRQFCQSA